MKKGQTKYSFNSRYFSNNNAESFYWAGFVAADGSLIEKYKNSKLLSISLHSRDRDHLLKFAANIEYSGKVRDYNYKTPESKIILYSDDIFYDLRRFNIVPRKTKIYALPEWLVEHQLLNHFVRGYVDGDGSFFSHKKSNRVGQLVISIRGTEQFLTQLENVFRSELGLRKKQVELNNNWFVLKYEGNGFATKIRDYLYEGSNPSIRMERKYNLSIQYAYNPSLRRSKPVSAKSNERLVKFKSISEAVRSGFTRSEIYKCLNGTKDVYKGFKWYYTQ